MDLTEVSDLFHYFLPFTNLLLLSQNRMKQCCRCVIDTDILIILPFFPSNLMLTTSVCVWM